MIKSVPLLDCNQYTTPTVTYMCMCLRRCQTCLYNYTLKGRLHTNIKINNHSSAGNCRIMCNCLKVLLSEITKPIVFIFST